MTCPVNGSHSDNRGDAVAAQDRAHGPSWDPSEWADPVLTLPQLRPAARAPAARLRPACAAASTAVGTTDPPALPRPPAGTCHPPMRALTRDPRAPSQHARPGARRRGPELSTGSVRAISAEHYREPLEPPGRLGNVSTSTNPRRFSSAQPPQRHQRLSRVQLAARERRGQSRRMLSMSTSVSGVVASVMRWMSRRGQSTCTPSTVNEPPMRGQSAPRKHSTPVTGSAESSRARATRSTWDFTPSTR